MNLFKLLWCKIVGHKVTEPHYAKECDGSTEVYEICDRCGFEINHITLYDCDCPPDALINVGTFKTNKDKDERGNK